MKQAAVVYLRKISHYKERFLGDPTMIYVEDDEMVGEVEHICRKSYKYPDTVEWIDKDTLRMRWEYDTTEGHGSIALPKHGVRFSYG